MSVLRSLESKIAGLVEGTFSRAFRSEVRPVEIARKLAREMEEHRTTSLNRVYAPNEYRVWLSPRDRERFAGYEDALASELVGYLLEHARREHLALTSRPVVEFETDERLGLGEFGIETLAVDLAAEADNRSERYAPPEPAAGPIADPPGRTMIFGSADRVAEPLEELARRRQETALLVMEGRRLVVGSEGVTLGRSRRCEIVVDDANVSRTHAEVRPRGGGWVLSDLGSTNGTRLNGRRLDQPEKLEPGDRIELGATTLTFELE
ncbi:MAG: FhaA domain-containing protein [Solirubrobacteraceae bacterium]